MPAVLTDTQLAELLVPAAWQPVLEDLQEFLACEQQRKQVSTDVPPSELLKLHDQLVERSEALLEPEALADLPRQQIQQVLLRSMLVLIRLKQAVIAEQPVLDTAGSRTLALFESDFYDTPANVDALLARARPTLQVTDEEVKQQQQSLDEDLVDARRNKPSCMLCEINSGYGQIVIRGEVNTVGLFQAIYPGVPIDDELIDVVVTSTLVFLCLPLSKDGQLQDAESKPWSVDERERMQQFLQQLKKFNQSRFANFPAFGFVAREQLDPAFVSELAFRANLGVPEVLRELPRVVTILPRDEIDKYLIHDIWGHGWQASMLRFDDLYDEMSRFAEPIELSPGIGQQDGCEWSRCFPWKAGSVRLHEQRLRSCILNEVSRRLPVALSAVMAEMMADVAEYKFLAEHPQRTDDLPSSSQLWMYPSLLDLTLAELSFYFRQATKVFRLWARQPARQQRWIEALVLAGATSDDAREAVQHAVRVWQEMESGCLLSELRWTPDRQYAGRLRVNVFTRVVLNFLGIHRSLVLTYRQLSALPTTALPLKSFRDLLVIAASVFFEADPPRNLWRVDEFLTLEFLPFCRQLADAERSA